MERGESVMGAGFFLPTGTGRKPRLPVKPVRTGSSTRRFQTGPNLKFKFEFKNEKIPNKF